VPASLHAELADASAKTQTDDDATAGSIA
jgi:hypothetical protein